MDGVVNFSDFQTSTRSRRAASSSSTAPSARPACNRSRPPTAPGGALDAGRRSDGPRGSQRDLARHRHQLDLAIVTGDNADSQQDNETRWFIDMLDGTTASGDPDPEMGAPADDAADRKLDPDSGVPTPGCEATPASVYDGVRDDGRPGPDDGYEPDSSSTPRDDGRLLARSRPQPGADRRPARGRRRIAGRAAADRPAHRPGAKYGLDEAACRQAASQVGPGLGRPPEAVANHDGYYSFVPKPGLRFVVLDTITDECGTPFCSEGSVDDTQFQWLRDQIEAAAGAGQYVIVFSHHTLRTTRFPSTGPSEQPEHPARRSTAAAASPSRPASLVRRSRSSTASTRT